MAIVKNFKEIPEIADIERTPAMILVVTLLEH